MCTMKRLPVVLVAILVLLLAPWSEPKFYYPAFMRRVRSLNRFLERHESDMRQLNTITDPELTQLTDLSVATEAIAGRASTWPKYREGM